MHEYALMQQVIAEIETQLRARGAAAGEVRLVQLRVGMFDVHSKDAFEAAFAAQTRGTALAGAHLQLAIEPASFHCSACDYTGTLNANRLDPHDPNPYAPCPLCGTVCAVRGGHGVSAIELQLADGVAE